MRILIFSEDPKTAAFFKVGRATRWVSEVRAVPWSELRKVLRSLTGPTLCYLDVATLEQRRLREYERLLGRQAHVVYGLLDRRGAVTDVAAAFHRGAVDYLDRTTLRAGVTSERLRRIRAYVEGINPELLSTPGADSTEAMGYIHSGADWSGIVSGREYTFVMMFIELDGREQMERQYGADNLSVALSSFRSYLESAVKPFQGRLWIWFRFGGVFLFPYRGRPCPALLCAFRLILFRHLYDIEGSLFPNFVSFRVGMHVGNLVYNDGDTGMVVSDSLNFLFHLGKQHAQPGGAYVTEEALRQGDPTLGQFFVSDGTFEGRKIMRMKAPLHGC